MSTEERASGLDMGSLYERVMVAYFPSPESAGPLTGLCAVQGFFDSAGAPIQEGAQPALACLPMQPNTLVKRWDGECLHLANICYFTNMFLSFHNTKYFKFSFTLNNQN